MKVEELSMVEAIKGEEEVYNNILKSKCKHLIKKPVTKVEGDGDISISKYLTPCTNIVV